MAMDSEPETVQSQLTPPRRVKGGSASIALGAAMIAVGEIIEPSKSGVEIEQTSDDPHDPDDLDLSFGKLPDLN